jgi:hypothetical protein
MANDHEGKTEAEILDVFFRSVRGALSALQALTNRGRLTTLRPILVRFLQECSEIVK